MTTLVALQPGYLPWLGYFDQLAAADIFVHYDDVQFDKNGWRNRNRIKGPAGPHWLTVPVRHRALGQRICEVEVVGGEWVRKHVATLTQAYAGAPYRDAYLPGLAAVLARTWNRLADLDIALADLLAGWFGIATRTVRASTLGLDGERSARLLSLCRRFGADRYYSGAAARDYLAVGDFAAAGVDVTFQDFVHPVYPQRHGAFVSHLSAIDFLFNAWPPGSIWPRRETI